MTRSSYGLDGGLEPNSQAAGFHTYTFQDAIDRAEDFVTSGGGNGQNRILKQSVLEAYDELCQAKDWQYFHRLYRVQVYAAVTGTCAYASSTRTFTIDSGSWPAWATAGATIRIDSINYLIRERTSSTALLADENQCPQADITTGESFSIFRNYYRLPVDFMAMSEPLDEQEFNVADYVSPSTWAWSQRYESQQSSPWIWTIMPDPFEHGRMTIAVTPGYDSDRSIEFMMRRRPRPLIYDGKATFCRAGTVSCTTSTITGTGTSFEPNMAGCVIRIARSGATTNPDGQGGNNPYERQAYISQDVSITDTSCGVEADWSVSSRKYTISDPLDLSPSMMTAFFRGCEFKVATKLSLKTLPLAEKNYYMALKSARENDSPISISRSCWDRPAIQTIHDRSQTETDDF